MISAWTTEVRHHYTCTVYWFPDL